MAINALGSRLIQVKTNRDPHRSSAKPIQLFDGLPADATKEIWVFRDYARVPVIKTIEGGKP